MGTICKYIYRHFYTKLFPDYHAELKKAVGDCKSLLDVGCGSSSPIKLFSKNLYSVGVDMFEPYIKKSKTRKIHSEYYKIGALDIGKVFDDESFDCVFAGDLIEHLDKKDGLSLLKMMERVAKEKVIIFTPNGFLPQNERDGNKLQIHKSGWSIEEMRSMGYDVIGINGWRPLRGSDTAIRFKPKFFWRIISDMTQFFVRNKPKYACQILCIKNIG